MSIELMQAGICPAPILLNQLQRQEREMQFLHMQEIVEPVLEMEIQIILE